MRSPKSFSEQKGYFTFVQNSPTTDYLELAYVQALSIKQTQKINKYAVAVDEQTKALITDKHKKVFDYVIDIGEDAAAEDEWKLKNEWKAWWLTPFKETVKLDCDMLFTRNIDHWWDGMQQTDVCLTSNIRDYEGNVSDEDVYRRLFVENNLPNVYSGFMYFRFTKTSMDFFIAAQEIFTNWDFYRTKVLVNCRDDQPTTDVVFAIAAMLIGEEKCVNPGLSYPTFAHMKGAINKFGVNTDWTDKLYAEIDNDHHLTIGFTRQLYPVHYHVKGFITPEVIQKYE